MVHLERRGTPSPGVMCICCFFVFEPGVGEDHFQGEEEVLEKVFLHCKKKEKGSYDQRGEKKDKREEKYAAGEEESYATLFEHQSE